MALAGTPVVTVYYGKPILPDVSRVLTCLYEKDVDFKPVDMYEGQQMPMDFLKLQASTTVPVIAFEDGSKLLFESREICRYISEKHSDRGNKYLLGRDLLERASIEQWLKSEEQSFNPPSWTLVFHLAFAPLTYNNHPDRVLLTQCEQKLAKVLDVYEQRLTESTFLAGNDFTLADLSHLPNSHYLANSGEWRYLFDSRKNVRRWFEQISTRPSWQKVVGLLDDIPVEYDEDAPTTLQIQHSMSSGAQPLKIVHQVPAAASVTLVPQASPPAMITSPPVPTDSTAPILTPKESLENSVQAITTSGTETAHNTSNLPTSANQQNLVQAIPPSGPVTAHDTSNLPTSANQHNLLQDTEQPISSRHPETASSIPYARSLADSSKFRPHQDPSSDTTSELAESFPTAQYTPQPNSSKVTETKPTAQLDNRPVDDALNPNPQLSNNTQTTSQLPQAAPIAQSTPIHATPAAPSISQLADSSNPMPQQDNRTETTSQMSQDAPVIQQVPSQSTETTPIQSNSPAVDPMKPSAQQDRNTQTTSQSAQAPPTAQITNVQAMPQATQPTLRSLSSTENIQNINATGSAQQVPNNSVESSPRTNQVAKPTVEQATPNTLIQQVPSQSTETTPIQSNSPGVDPMKPSPQQDRSMQTTSQSAEAPPTARTTTVQAMPQVTQQTSKPLSSTESTQNINATESAQQVPSNFMEPSLQTNLVAEPTVEQATPNKLIQQVPSQSTEITPTQSTSPAIDPMKPSPQQDRSTQTTSQSAQAPPTAQTTTVQAMPQATQPTSQPLSSTKNTQNINATETAQQVPSNSIEPSPRTIQVANPNVEQATPNTLIPEPDSESEKTIQPQQTVPTSSFTPQTSSDAQPTAEFPTSFTPQTSSDPQPSAEFPTSFTPQTSSDAQPTAELAPTVEASAQASQTINAESSNAQLGGNATEANTQPKQTVTSIAPRIEPDSESQVKTQSQQTIATSPQSQNVDPAEPNLPSAPTIETIEQVGETTRTEEANVSTIEPSSPPNQTDTSNTPQATTSTPNNRVEQDASSAAQAASDTNQQPSQQAPPSSPEVPQQNSESQP